MDGLRGLNRKAAPLISVITASLPERHRLFAECAESVARQSLQPAAWHVAWDYAKRGPIPMYNELAQHVTTPWLFPLADDDLLERDHFDTLRPFLTDAHDVVYTWCRVEGGQYPEMYQRPFDRQRLYGDNSIPASACIRTELWQKLGGYQKPQNPNVTWEDWDFWLRALDEGAKFLCVPIVTWTYRMGNWDRVSA